MSEFHWPSTRDGKVGYPAYTLCSGVLVQQMIFPIDSAVKRAIIEVDCHSVLSPVSS
jgi:hypothetical protein